MPFSSLCLELARIIALNVRVMHEHAWITDDTILMFHIALFYLHVVTILLGLSWTKHYTILQMIVSVFALTVLVNNEAVMFRGPLFVLDCYISIHTVRTSTDLLDAWDLRYFIPSEFFLLAALWVTVIRCLPSLAACCCLLWYMSLACALSLTTLFA